MDYHTPAERETPVNDHFIYWANGVLVMLRHPGMGWLAFVLPHEHRVHLTSLWLHQSLLHKPAEAAAAPTAETPVEPPPTPNFGAGGSGTVH